jgi:signal transduction histidine kinase
VRRELAAELHDELGPDLTALNFNMALINNNVLPEPGGYLAELMADSAQLVDGMSGKVRNIIARLQPPVLSSYGLAAALRWYAGQMKRRTGMTVTIVAERAFPRMPADQELSLFRIAKESLNNAAKYSGAVNVMVRLRSGKHAVRLTVSDNGAGFVPAAPPLSGSGWGLTIMRMRAKMLGGAFHLRTAPGRGTVIHIAVPKEETDAL